MPSSFVPHTSQSPVTFQIVAPGAKAVQLASDLFGWDRPKPMQREGDRWFLTVPLPDDVRIEYQFVVDGVWHRDPDAPEEVANGFGGTNSCFVGKAYRHDVPDDVPGLPMRRLSIRVGGENAAPRTITLYLPEGATGPFPILLYGDGKEYEQHVRPQFILENLRQQGLIRPTAVALIPPHERIAEYWKSSVGYEHFVVQDVLPAIRKRAPISVRPEDVFVGGASLGGLISMRLAEHFPDQIAGGVHSQSGAFWASPGVFARSALARLSPQIKLFLDWGSYEGVLTVSNDRMAEALRRMERPFGHRITSEGHNWTAWRGRFAEGIAYLLAPK